MSDLLPCPFCGGTDLHEGVSPSGLNWIYCWPCHASKHCYDKDAAIGHWNRRAILVAPGMPEEPKEIAGGLWSAPFGTAADALTAWVGYATVLRSWASAEVGRLTGQGTLYGRLEWLANYAKEHCGYDPTDSIRGPEQAIIEKLEQAERALERQEGIYEPAERQNPCVRVPTEEMIEAGRKAIMELVIPKRREIPRPTIAELEKILNSEAPRGIELHPDGTASTLEERTTNAREVAEAVLNAALSARPVRE